ncbi:hypothetical protein EMCRGX_G000559 [Ephydatia muelleri]
MELGKDDPEPTTMERVSAVTKVTAKAAFASLNDTVVTCTTVVNLPASGNLGYGGHISLCGQFTLPLYLACIYTSIYVAYHPNTILTQLYSASFSPLTNDNEV